MKRPLRIKSKSQKVKVRKTWTRHPGEQIIPRRKGKQPNKKKLENEALEDYGEPR